MPDQPDQLNGLDPVVELVRNAIGYGVMMALADKASLMANLSALPSDGSLADALTADAEGFIRTRADLVEAVTIGVLAPYLPSEADLALDKQRRLARKRRRT